jgi:hypothetical protein
MGMGNGDWTQRLSHARQLLYYWSTLWTWENNFKRLINWEIDYVHRRFNHVVVSVLPKLTYAPNKFHSEYKFDFILLSYLVFKLINYFGNCNASKNLRKCQK